MTYPPGGSPHSQFSPYGGHPPPKKSSSTPVVIIVVCVVAVLLCCGGGAVAFFVFGVNKEGKAAQSRSSMSSSRYSSSSYSPYSTYSSRSSTPYSTRTTTQSAPKYSVGDCFQMSDDSVRLGTCGNGGSPYQIYKIGQAESECRDNPTIKSGSYHYCLALDLQVHYCYTSPEARGWVHVADVCKGPGTVVVFDVIPGSQNGSSCNAASNRTRFRYYTWREPPKVFCYWPY